MKTNYDNLSAFDACAIIVAVIGLVLIGFQIYLTLPAQQQMAVNAGLMVLDVHQEAMESAEGIETVFSSLQYFYDEFALAFEQTFNYPDEVGAPIIKFAQALQEYSVSVGGEYAKANLRPSVDPGDVLGAYLINAGMKETQVYEPKILKSKPSYFKYEYDYQAPGLVEKLIK